MVNRVRERYRSPYRCHRVFRGYDPIRTVMSPGSFTQDHFDLEKISRSFSTLACLDTNKEVFTLVKTFAANLLGLTTVIINLGS